jgi:hypothetical protein
MNPNLFSQLWASNRGIRRVRLASNGAENAKTSPIHTSLPDTKFDTCLNVHYSEIDHAYPCFCLRALWMDKHSMELQFEYIVGK